MEKIPKVNQNSPLTLFFNKVFGLYQEPVDVVVGNFSKNNTTLKVDQDLSISFVRTVRLPECSKPQQLPLGFGTLPLFSVNEYEDILPQHIVDKGGLLMPMHS
jgi:hypothetical protein